MTTRTPATEKPVQLDVAILGRDYKVACRESERAELMQAVALLDGRMREPPCPDPCGTRAKLSRRR